MWPNLMENNILKKILRSNNFVADFPNNSTETMLDIPSVNQGPPLSSKKRLIDQDTYKIFVGSWNVGGVAPPEELDMEDWLHTKENPVDVYVLGFQEIVPLNVGNILASENRKISTKWNSLIDKALNKSTAIGEEEKMSSRGEFECITSKQMVGIFISVWVKSDVLQYIQYPSVSSVGCGVMGCLGNKGSVSVRFYLHQTSFCFVCSHLASGGKEGDQRHRNSNATEILSRTRFPCGPSRNLPTKILHHDQIIWLGDLNYRIYLADATTRSLVEKKEWNVLLDNDQLKAELMEGHVFQGWREGVIKFAPTYKYYPNSGVYYGQNQQRKGEKRRSPAWCDRIIWFGNGLKQNEYNRGESKLSDHRAVRAIFTTDSELLGNSKPLESFFSNGFDCINSHLEECSNVKFSRNNK